MAQSIFAPAAPLMRQQSWTPSSSSSLLETFGQVESHQGVTPNIKLNHQLVRLAILAKALKRRNIMVQKWTTTETEDAIIHVSEGGFIAREGTPEHTHHEFYARYQPRAINSWHRGSPAELIETERKRRQAEE